MDWLVYAIGVLALLGTLVAFRFLPRWLRRGEIIWLLIVAGLLTASGSFLLALFPNFTRINYEDRAVFMLFWAGVLVALNGTIVLKLPSGRLAPEAVDED